MTTRGLAKLVRLGVILAIAAAAARLLAQPARLLVLTHSAGYEHDVVRRPGAWRQAIAEQVIAELGRQPGAFAATFLESEPELRALTSAALRDFHAFLFFTTGILPLAASARAELLARVHSGSGFVGVHSASDTWYDVPGYGEMLGGVFDGHPWHERVTIVMEDPKHPATAHLGAAFSRVGECRPATATLVTLRPDPPIALRGSRTFRAGHDSSSHQERSAKITSRSSWIATR